MPKPSVRKGKAYVERWMPRFGFTNYAVTVGVLPPDQKGQCWGRSWWNVAEEWADIELVPDGILPDDQLEGLVLHELAHGLVELARSGDGGTETVCNRLARLLGAQGAPLCNEWVHTQDDHPWGMPDEPEESRATEHKWVKLLVDWLPEPDRQVVNGLFYEGQTLRGMAKELGVSPRTIGRIRDRALASLNKRGEALT